ncbi:MAG: hypothetical protein E7613_03745 [Ruminococcaceae bacterium]|nr:hypothetical protein [Oscillospiraceae bacterium]
MTKRITRFLTIALSVLMVLLGMSFSAMAEEINSTEIMQKMLVVYNLDEKVQDGVSYFPVHVYAAIDSLKYEEVGLSITVSSISGSKEPATQVRSKTTVYSSMKVTNSNGTATTYTPDQLGGAYLFGDEMLFTATNWVGTDVKITVTPYAINKAGDTIHGKTIEITDEAIKERDPSSGLFRQIEKFELGTLTEAYSGDTVALGQLFNAAEGVEIDSSLVTVTVSENVTYAANTEDWTQSTVTFENVGSAAVTIKEGNNLATTAEVEVKAADKFNNKFTETDKFLYRIGNSNNVAMSSLFAASGEGVIDSAKVNVTVEGIEGSATGTFTANTSDWTNGSLKFSGTGTVKVTVNEGENIPTELYLEVVNAVNTTGIINATSNNVVLLNDTTAGSAISVSNGYAIYGNGFTVTWPNDICKSNWVAGFIEMNNGTLDNVQIVCPNFSFAGMYQYQLLSTAYGNVQADVSGSKDWYYNICCAVLADGDCQILNSKISGGRIAMYARTGKFLFDNSTFVGGAVATVQIGSAKEVTFRDTNIITKPTQATVHDTSKTLMGFSVLVMAEETGESTPITIDGEFNQYAWVCSDYKQYVPSDASSVVTAVLAKADYKHNMSLDGGSNKDWFCLGIAYMPQEQGNTVSVPTINDNRTNKTEIPYSVASLTTMGTTTRIYTYDNSNGTHADSLAVPEFAVTSYSNVRPELSYTQLAEGIGLATAFDIIDGKVQTLTIDLDTTGDYTFDFADLVAIRDGNEFEYTVSKADGTAVDKTQGIVFDDSGVYDYIITVSDNKKYGTDGVLTDSAPEYVKLLFTVVATKTSIMPPEKVAEVGGTALVVAKSYDGDWSIAIPALEGVQIKYYSKASREYKTVALADITPTTKGKQNGTESFWEKTIDNEYTLRISSSYIHEGKNVYGMPVVVENSGKYTMYFTISSTNGYVSTGTSARTCTLTYTFTDSNGGSITFTKGWNVNRQNYIDDGGKQYSYSDLVNGTLTELSSGSSGGGCVTPDTLITLADGTQVRVDALTGEEELLVWNMETGKLDSAPIMFVDSESEAEVTIVELVFSDGTAVDVIYEHGFWDYDLNRYVYLDENAADYIGHTFAKHNGDALEKVQLVEVNITRESSMAYSPVTAGHLCYFVNGMLSMPGGVGGLFNIFEVDPETMTYDLEAMERDIAEYGLFTYEEMAELVPELPESMFDAAGGKYLKISIGKGNMTVEELEGMIIRYTKFF